MKSSSASSVANQLTDVHPKMLRAEIERDRKAIADLGEADRKKLAELSEGDRKRIVARAVERALEIAGVSKQEASHQMGYSDQGTVSRWCSAVERPLFDKLFIIEGFIEAFIVAISEGNPAIVAETIVRIRRRA